VNVTVTACPVKTWCSGLTNSISTLCWPGGSPTTLPDPWRYVESARAEHRYDVHVLHPVLDLDDAMSQLIGKRGVHDQLGCGLVLDGDVR
jgi:hypothetical protein